MASLRKRSDAWVLCFRVGEVQFNRDVGTEEIEASARKKRVEAFLLDLKTGRRTIPSGLSPEQIGTWVLSDGKIIEKPSINVAPRPTLFGELLDSYLESFHAKKKERTTQTTEAVHVGHFRRLLDTKKPAMSLENADLQGFITRRMKEDGIRGGKISTQTIRKEIETLKAIWA